MATVYKAVDRQSGAVVLLKRVRLGADAERRWRFAEEARLAAGVAHPNVVRVLGADAEAGALVAEWVEGTDLGAWLDANGPLPAALAAFVAREAARGLAAVHAAGILHRDVSAANALLGADGVVKLTDFGLASLVPADPGEVRGTLGTLAPEVVRGEPPTPASDLFSLGAVLAHALTGRPPFAAADASGTLDAVLHADPAAALAADPRVPTPLAAVAGALLAKAPAARLGDATEAADRLTDALDAVGGASADDLATYLAEPAAYRPPSFPPPPTSAPTASEPNATPPTRRRWGVAALVGVAALAIGAIALWPRTPDDPRGGVVAEEPPMPAPLAVSPDTASAPAIETDRASSEPEPDEPTALPPASESDVPLPGEPVAAADPVPEAAPPRGRPTTEPPTMPASGTLALAVEPWARVRLGDRNLGTTPFAPVALPAGEHALTLLNPDFPTHTVRVRVEAGERTQATFSLWDLVGRVTLEVSPWARVTVDGEPWDTVPPQDRPLILAPGDHVLGFEHPTLGAETVALRIAAGEQRTVRVRMGG